jgi:hypothetical protein
VSGPELDEWRAFYQLEPFGQDWLQTALACAVSAQGALKKRGGGGFKPDDFLPVKPPVQPESGRDMFAKLRAWAAIHNKALGFTADGRRKK